MAGKKKKEKSMGAKIRAYFGMGTPKEKAEDKKAGRNTQKRGKALNKKIDKYAPPASSTRKRKDAKGYKGRKSGR